MVMGIPVAAFWSSLVINVIFPVDASRAFLLYHSDPDRGGTKSLVGWGLCHDLLLSFQPQLRPFLFAISLFLSVSRSSFILRVLFPLSFCFFFSVSLSFSLLAFPPGICYWVFRCSAAGDLSTVIAFLSINIFSHCVFLDLLKLGASIYSRIPSALKYAVSVEDRFCVYCVGIKRS